MIDAEDIRAGDVLSVTCPFTPAEVVHGVGAAGEEIAVRWPWWEIDESRTYGHWNGVVALGVARDGGHVPPVADAELFRTEPAAERLAAGDRCRVGIPPTVVHVTGVERHDPPLETVWLPRPTRTVTVLRRGLSYREYPDGSHLDGSGYTLHPGDGIPYAFELVMRPYAALLAGDEIADAAGRAWRFDGPWDWTAFDGDSYGAAPVWPLTLLARAGAPRSPEGSEDPEARAVAVSTANGSHEETVRAWTALTGASPTP
ncbi:hypothetical protein [Streptomyces sp. NPDC002530]